MRIKILTTWNATDGTSLHAELVAREWVKTNSLTVFAPTLESMKKHWAHLPIRADEDFVIRGFEQTWGKPGWIDERVASDDCDVLVVEALDRMPVRKLVEVFPSIKAKKVQVIHEWALPNIPGYFDLNFDAIVCFDHRYRTMLLEKHPLEKIHIIPYPCHPESQGSKQRARKILGLPDDKIILFSFGRQPLFEYDDYLWLVDEFAREMDLIYLVIRSDDEEYFDNVNNKFKTASCCELRFERPDIDRLYDYLHAADVHLIAKAPSDNIVVSSTVLQSLGSGTPAVIIDSRYVELHGDEVIKYRPGDRAHLRSQVLRVLKDEVFRRKTLEGARKYVDENDAMKISRRFLELFQSLTQKDNKMINHY